MLPQDLLNYFLRHRSPRHAWDAYLNFNQWPTKSAMRTHSLYVHFGCCFGSLPGKIWRPCVDPQGDPWGVKPGSFHSIHVLPIQSNLQVLDLIQHLQTFTKRNDILLVQLHQLSDVLDVSSRLDSTTSLFGYKYFFCNIPSYAYSCSILVILLALQYR